MHRFKEEGWVHFEGMDVLFSNDLARGSRAYHPAAVGTTAHSGSANASTAPPSASDISMAPSASRVSSSVSGVPPGISGVPPGISGVPPGISGVPPGISDNMSSTAGVPGISAGHGIPEFSPFNFAGPNYGTHMSSSSHTSSNPVMTPSTSPAHLQYRTPFIGSPTGTVAQGETSEKVAFPHGVNQQLQMFSPPFRSLHSSIPSPSSYNPSSRDSRAPSVAGSTQSKKRSFAEVGAPPGGQGLSAQAALENLSLNPGERSSKRAKKEQLTPAMLVGVQGTLQYVGSAITSSSVVAAEQRRSERIHSALAALGERDPDLPDVIKVAMMEAFRKDPGTIDFYLMTPDKSLRWHWIKTCLFNLGLIPADYELTAPY